MKVRNHLGNLVVALALFTGANAVAKDSRNLSLDHAVTLNGKQLTPGQYQVSWETHSPEATVTFKQKKSVVATAEGKLVERPYNFEADAVVYANNPDGSKTILEIRFGGTNKVLTFGESSPTSQLITPNGFTASATTSRQPRRAGSAQQAQFLGKPRANPVGLRTTPFDLSFALMTPNRIPETPGNGAKKRSVL